MALTNSQIINGIGYLDIWINQAKNYSKVLVDPNATSTDKTNALTQIGQCMQNIYKLMNTACQAQGIATPTGTYTNAQLQAMGIV